MRRSTTVHVGTVKGARSFELLRPRKSISKGVQTSALVNNVQMGSRHGLYGSRYVDPLAWKRFAWVSLPWMSFHMWLPARWVRSHKRDLCVVGSHSRVAAATPSEMAGLANTVQHSVRWAATLTSPASPHRTHRAPCGTSVRVATPAQPKQPPPIRLARSHCHCW